MNKYSWIPKIFMNKKMFAFFLKRKSKICNDFKNVCNIQKMYTNLKKMFVDSKKMKV